MLINEFLAFDYNILKRMVSPLKSVLCLSSTSKQNVLTFNADLVVFYILSFPLEEQFQILVGKFELNM